MRPDTSLTVVVTDKDGNTHAMDSHASDPTYRPRGIQFGTQQGSGFYTASFDVSCPIDHEHPAIHLRDKVQFVGANGDVAYEGFVADMPRSTTTDGQGTLSINLAGYMADTARASFTMPFVDRDLSAWGPMGIGRRIALVGAGTPWRVTDPAVGSDTATLLAAVVLTHRLEGGGAQPIAEAWYDAGPAAKVASVYYKFAETQTQGADADWFTQLFAADTDASVTETGTDLHGPGTTGNGAYTPSTPRRYVGLQFGYNATTAASTGTERLCSWQQLAVYGNHGLPLVGDTYPKGVAASDVIRWLIDTYCPKLNSAGVQDTTYPIEHLTFRDRTKVYDALLKVNSFHLWQLATWENGTVHFGPIDLNDWDFEVRHDVRGTAIGLQGDSVENLRNGIIVQFQNVATGATEELHPDNYPDLRDTSLDNPWTQHGDASYGETFQLPFPTTTGNALELGRLKLAESNQATSPGSFTIEHHIYDRAGVQQPAWKVRAGDRVRLTSTANLSDRPRLVQETSWSHDSKTVTIGVDSTLRVLDALVDRTLTAMSAANLS